MADIHKLVVALEAENAKLHSKLDQSQKRLKRFEKRAKSVGKSLKNMAKVGGAAFATLGGAAALMSKKVLDAADRVGKLSQSTGLSSELLSRLNYQAQLSGTSFEASAKGIAKFQRAIYDANEGLKSQADAFDAVGVSITNADGSLRSTEDVMGDVADKFKNMADGAEKAALAQILFGRAGVEMIPLLNQGRDGLKAMADEADELGITMSGKLTAAAERTNDNLTRIKTAIQGVFLRVMAKAIPHVENMAKAMVRWAKEPGNVANAIQLLSNAMKTFTSIGLVTKHVLVSIGKAIGGIFAALLDAVQGDLSKAAEKISFVLEDISKSGRETWDDLYSTWTDAANRIEQKAPAVAKKIASPIRQAGEEISKSKKDIEKDLKQLERDIASKLKSAKGFAKDLNKEFADRVEKLTSEPENEPASSRDIIDVSMLDLQAKNALNAGDFDTAVDKGRKAFDLLDKMKEAGVLSNLELDGMAKRLQRLGEQIGQEKIANIGTEIKLDSNKALRDVADLNAFMQHVLDETPLVQTIKTVTEGLPTPREGTFTPQPQINPDVIPRETVARTAEKPKEYRPVNVYLPSGEVVPFYGDSNTIDHMERAVDQVAMQRGARL